MNQPRATCLLVSILIVLVPLLGTVAAKEPALDKAWQRDGDSIARYDVLELGGMHTKGGIEPRENFAA